MEILASDVEKFSSVIGMHAIVREEGHYFGNCVFFHPPNVAPIGHDNKVCMGLTYPSGNFIFSI